MRQSERSAASSAAHAVLAGLAGRRETLAVAESCTGGGVGAALTSIPGASEVFLGGVIAYSDRLKIGLLGVPAETIAAHGAVSGQCARAMAQGARRATGADWAVSVTGVAGPGGGSPGKPVGTVWVAVEGPGEHSVERHLLSGSRGEVRDASVTTALALVRRLVGGQDV